ncbi:MAG: hypothetical protein AAGF91_15660, partial [Actinomycetota bacterium]
MNDRHPHPTRIAALAPASQIALAACASDGETADLPATTPANTPDVTGEPDTGDDVLTPNDTTHFGLTWFSPPPPDSAATVNERWVEATDAST